MRILNIVLGTIIAISAYSCNINKEIKEGVEEIGVLTAEQWRETNNNYLRLDSLINNGKTDEASGMLDSLLCEDLKAGYKLSGTFDNDKLFSEKNRNKIKNIVDTQTKKIEDRIYK